MEYCLIHPTKIQKKLCQMTTNTQIDVVFCPTNKSVRRRGAHCGAALSVRVSVDHVGKLFERIEANTQAAEIKHNETTHSGSPIQPASFCPRHGNLNAQVAFRSAGRISFVTFLWPSKKSKTKKR